MSVATSEYIKAIPFLPSRAELVVKDADWEEYEQLLEDLGPKNSARVFYNQGRMWIVPPLPDHERPKVVVNRLIGALSEELKMPVVSFGSSTLKREGAEKGAEPDDSFYIRDAGQLLNKRSLDLDSDPPPDIVVEIDHTNSSIDKFSIYAGLGVSEIWRIVASKVEIHVLAGDHYEESDASSVFPFLDAQTLSTFLEQGLLQGEWIAAPAFREWLKQHYSDKVPQ
jgi:Uma2 family endonuclease